MSYSPARSVPPPPIGGAAAAPRRLASNAAGAAGIDDSVDVLVAATALSVTPSERQLERALANHLVAPRLAAAETAADDFGAADGRSEVSVTDSESQHHQQQQQELQQQRSLTPSHSFGSVSHSLVGGSITHDIYQYRERREAALASSLSSNSSYLATATSAAAAPPSPAVGNVLVAAARSNSPLRQMSPSSPARRLRRNSEPDINSAPHRQTPDLVRASDLMEPGVFRRHFVAKRVAASGRSTRHLGFTRNFVDFLALYGAYGGDVEPDEEDKDDDDDDLDGDVEEGVDGVAQDAEDEEAVGRVQENWRARDSAAGGYHAGVADRGEAGAACAISPPFASEATPLLGGPDAAAPTTTVAAMSASALSHSRSRSGPSTAVPSVHGTSDKKAFFMLVKAFIGTGVLFLPKAFANGGIVFSTVLIILLGWLTLHCMLLLVETSRKLGGSFGDIGEKLYGAGMRRVVLASIAISQAGFCCAYYIFVAQNLRDLLMIVSNCRWIVPDWYFILLQLALYIPLSWVRRIKHFHITSLVADLFILLGLAYIFFYDLSILATRGVSHDIVWLNWNGFSLCLGTAMFAFEGICLILPIAESMKHPSHFSRLITLVMLVVGGCFLAIGATGYLTFGDSVATVVFMNMPKSSPTVLALQFLYALAILLSFPLSVYPTVRITESAVFPPALDVAGAGKRSPLVKWQKNTVRAFLVAGLAAAAFAGRQHLDRVVALVGCLACIPLSFVYPAVFHYHVAQSHWVKQKDLLVAALGVLAVVYTTYLTIVEWMQGSPDLPVDRCAARGDGGGSTW